MSAMYYTYPDKRPIGQTHNKGKDKGYHFTWTMYPMDFAMFYHQARLLDLTAYTVQADDRDEALMLVQFIEIIRKAASQSFEEGLE